MSHTYSWVGFFYQINHGIQKLWKKLKFRFLLNHCKYVLSLRLTLLKRTFKKNTFLQPPQYDQLNDIIKVWVFNILITLPLCLTGLSLCLDTENTTPKTSTLHPDQNEPETLNTFRTGPIYFLIYLVLLLVSFLIDNFFLRIF